MRTIGIIPARYASTRFPGKPLADILGKSMIQRVYEQACASKLLDEVIVATDDTRIFSAVADFGGKAVMTSSEAANGTERVAEVAKAVNASWIVNIQGDEPVIDPSMIDQLIQTMLEEPAARVGTLVKHIKSGDVLTDPNIPKVVVDKNFYAIYFSRSAIPFYRDKEKKENWHSRFKYFQHIGLYMYKKDFLIEFVQWPQSELELAEKLEQLRIIEHGYKIRVVETTSDSISVDVPKDIEKVEQFLKGRTS